jgi:hypothetical protein
VKRWLRAQLLGWAIAGAAVGCLAHLPPATLSTLACSLIEFRRLGYQVQESTNDSSWHRILRSSGSTSEEVWIRLVDDGRSPAWLEARVAGWNNVGPRPADNYFVPFQAWSFGSQSHEDIRRVLDQCK